MDFSNSAFRVPRSTSKVSSDTMSHTNLVMACRWGWTSSPDANTAWQTTAPSTTTQQPPSKFNNIRSRRFAPCQGRLYHQLVCSHRIRTDLVDDCGANCVEPFGGVAGSAFFCNECFEADATKIWEERKKQHNAAYPPLDQMGKDLYNQYYREHRQLEADYARDRKMYEIELKSTSRPSNRCAALEVTDDEMEFATELDTLSLSLMASNDDIRGQAQVQARPRVSLPNDASEQLHWDLDTLTLDRGLCGIEYSSQPNNGMPPLRQLDEDDMWRKPRDRN
jgi:hypothetical protein